MIRVALFAAFFAIIRAQPSAPALWSVSTLAGSRGCGIPARDGVGTAAAFSSPYLLAAGTGDTAVYIADGGSDRLRALTANGTVSTIAGSVRGFADGSGAAAKFNFPIGVAALPSSPPTLFVADNVNESAGRHVDGRAHLSAAERDPF